MKCDGTRADTRFRLSAKRTSPFKSAGASVQSTIGSRGVRISGSNAGYTTLRGRVKGTGYPLLSPVSPHFPSHASPCAITFQLESTYKERRNCSITIQAMCPQLAARQLVLCDARPRFKLCIQCTTKITQELRRSGIPLLICTRANPEPAHNSRCCPLKQKRQRRMIEA